MKIVAAVLVLMIVIGGAAAAVVLLLTPSSDTPEKGIPKLEYYTTDLAGVLTIDDLNWIDEICYEVDVNSSCEMAVVVVNTTQPYDMNYFALRTFQYNGIGNAGRDNGVLVVVATDDQAWRIEVGYGLEGFLTDTRVKHLAEVYLEPSMENGTYGDGLFDLMYWMGLIIEEEYAGDRSGHPAFELFGHGFTWLEIGIIAVVVVVLTIVTRGRALYPILLIISLLSGSGGGGGFGGGRSGGGGAFGRR
jgi:uncharacterized protein